MPLTASFLPSTMGRGLIVVALGSAMVVAAAAGAAADDVERGRYLTRAGGCIPCHTDLKGGGPELAGGRPLKTPFGTFFSPNITPDPDTGIGRWSDADFLAALKQGVRPDGAHYFPVFPYPSYARLSDADALAIKAYLFSRPAMRRANRAHDVAAPFGWRWLQAGWKFLFFAPAEFRPESGQSAEYNRGAYLATALTHCGECHTPRNVLGAVQSDWFLAGTADGPEGELAPNITPHQPTGIGDWSKTDVADLLKTALKPDFDNVQGTMREAVEHGLKYLTDADRGAIATFILGQPAIDNKIRRKAAVR